MNTIMKKTNGQSSNSTLPSPRTFSGLVDEFFNDNLNRFFDDNFLGFRGSLNRSQVPANIRETDKTYEIELIAPGLKKEDLHIDVNGETLTISFQQKSEDRQEKDGWLRQEYSMESFTRTFNLDDSVDTSKVSARYNDGILYMTLPKKEGAQRIKRTIEIK